MFLLAIDANSNQITIIVWTKASSVVCLVNVVFFGKIKSIENKRLPIKSLSLSETPPK